MLLPVKARQGPRGVWMATDTEGSGFAPPNESEAKVWDHWGVEPEERL